MTTSAPTDLDEPPADAPRFLRAFWRLVRWALPVAFRYFGTYEYRIAQVYYDAAHSTLAVDLQATADTVAMGLTDIPKVTPWSGLSGAVPNPTAGARVLVQFINGNAARPIVVAWAPWGDSGWQPASLTIDATGALTLGGSATSVSVGGPGGSALALAPALQAFADNVVSVLGALTPPVVVTPLAASVATVKAKGT